MTLKRILPKIGLAIGIIFIVIIFVGPFLWMVITSLKTNEDIYSPTISYFPKPVTFENYKHVIYGMPGLAKIDFLGCMERSFVVALLASIISITISSLASYSFSRFNFKYKDQFSLLILITQIIPPILLVVPLFLILRDFGLVNNVGGLTLTYITITLPFSIFLLRGYFSSIPLELEDAASIDGCSRLQSLIRVVLPLSAPGVVATFIYSFITCWNEFLFAFIIMPKLPTLTVGIYSFVGQYTIYWGQLMAASIISILPMIVLFFPFQKYIIGGLTTGSFR